MNIALLDRAASAHVGPRLRDMRLARGWSQAEIARRAGVSRATVAAIEGGRYTRVRIDSLEGLARALARPPHYFLLPGGAEHVQAFRRSAWYPATRCTLQELAWLESLPEALWLASPPTPQAVAELLAWLRRHGRLARINHQS